MSISASFSAIVPQFISNIKYAWSLVPFLGALDACFTKNSFAQALLNYSIGLVGICLAIALLQYFGVSPVFGQAEFSAGVMLCIGCWLSLFVKKDLKYQIFMTSIVGTGAWFVDTFLQSTGFYAKRYRDQWGISTLYFLVISAVIIAIVRLLRRIEMKESAARMLVSIIVLCIIIAGIYLMQDTIRSIVLAIVMILAYPVILSIVLRPDILASGDIRAMYAAGVKNIPILGKLFGQLPGGGSGPTADP